MIHILYTYISEENHKSLLKEFSPNFSIDFQNRIMRFRRWQDAQLSFLGRILLYTGIKKFNKEYEENSIKYTKYKKPYFEDGEIQFNISHSGEMVVCVVSDAGDIGIDIELLKNINIEDFKPQMTDNEWKQVATSSSKIDSFYTYWTQKEAVIKAHGKGLFFALKSFEISENEAIIDGKTFFLREIKLDDKYKCFISTNTLITKELIRITALKSFNSHISAI
jgi:4'-phosphopantetheinyl transferase